MRLPVPCLAVVVVVAACSSSPAPVPPAATASQEAADEWIGERPAWKAVSDTGVTVSRPGSVVTIQDRRILRRASTGDFDALVTRSHQGSEAGDTDESFRAIRVGRDFFTRGSGGPFVQWDDARDEPDAAANAVLQGSRDLLAMAEKCGRVAEEGPSRTFALASEGCVVSQAPSGASFQAVVTRLEGESRRGTSGPASLRLRFVLDLEAGGRRATVTVEHRLTVSDLPAGESVAAPDDAVSARRERPVMMARQVLGGLVEPWGPGAPELLRKPPSPDR